MPIPLADRKNIKRVWIHPSVTKEDLIAIGITGKHARFFMEHNGPFNVVSPATDKVWIQDGHGYEWWLRWHHVMTKVKCPFEQDT